MRLTVPTPRLDRKPLIDVTRLLRARARPFATGVERIDLALARALTDRHGAECGFVVAGRRGPAMLPAEESVAFLHALDARWAGEVGSRPDSMRLRALLARAALWPDRPRDVGDHVYVNASHSGLPARRGAMAALDPAGRMARFIYLHDLIPLDYPEYQRPATAARFAAFLAEAITAGARIGANSADTARRIAARLGRPGDPAPEILVPVVEMRKPGRPPRPAVAAILDSGRPYFICLGTIEPRKNHLLLLALWRELAAEGAAPTLVIVGRRGWENEMVLDMLDRCAALRPHVREFGDLADDEAAALLAGARALLFPSFAEGLGVPLLEASALGVPAILSDIPVFRELAPPGAVFLHPLDGPGWRREILRMA